MARIEIDLSNFDTDELISELRYRRLSKDECRDLLYIVGDVDIKPLFSSTLLGEDVYNTLVELVKSKNELELLELFEKAK